jgi:hypothetical protein
VMEKIVTETFWDGIVSMKIFETRDWKVP